MKNMSTFLATAECATCRHSLFAFFLMLRPNLSQYRACYERCEMKNPKQRARHATLSSEQKKARTKKKKICERKKELIQASNNEFYSSYFIRVSLRLLLLVRTQNQINHLNISSSYLLQFIHVLVFITLTLLSLCSSHTHSSCMFVS